MATPEGKVKAAVRRWLGEHAQWHFMPPGTGFGRSGIPDIVGCAPVTITPGMVGDTIGVFFAIETKAPGKLHNTTTNQNREISAIRANAGLVFVVDDVEAAKRLLKGPLCW